MLYRFARIARVPLVVLATTCSTPEVAPANDVAAPVATRSDAPPAEVVRGEASKEPELEPAPPKLAESESEPVAPEPAAKPKPWGSPLQLTGKNRGLQWTTTAQVERSATTLQLAIDVELRNTTRAPMKVSLHPPLVTVMTTPVPGTTGEGMGIGMRGEGFGSDVCSPGHGGPTTLPPGGRSSVPRKTVELDPLPWPPRQAHRITASSSDCRPGRLVLDVLDVTIVQPASPDGVPTLVASQAPTTGR